MQSRQGKPVRSPSVDKAGHILQSINLSVIIPCYNEADVIQHTYDRVKAVLNEHFPSHEILTVNDGSSDQTPDILNDLAQKDPRLRVIHFSRNFGHEQATTAGIHHALGERAVIIDADLQDPPELFPEMDARMTSTRCNILYAVRRNRDGEGFVKKLTSKGFYRFINLLSDQKMPVDTGDFRMIDRKVMETFKRYTERNKYVRGIYSQMGYHQEPFYYNREKRLAGNTKYNYVKLTKMALDIIFYYSNKPLNLSVNIGTISILISFGLTVYAVIGHFIQNTPGWASSVIITLFLGGTQLLILGIIGKYIGNIFDEVKGRPSYIIDTMVNEGNTIPPAPQDKKTTLPPSTQRGACLR